MAPLDRALALTDGEHAAVRVGDDLDLDVARGDDRLLEIEPVVTERGVGLGSGHGKCAVEPVGRRDEPHALAAAAGRRLQEHGISELGGRGGGLAGGDRRRAGHERNAGGPHLVASSRLVAHPSHDLRRGADEDDVVLGTRLCERWVLGEEAPPRMDGLAAGRVRGRHDRGDT
jgi:hypothetical protein